MTVTEAATLYGKSTQGIYKRIENAGMQLDTFRDKQSKQITEAGEKLLNQLYGSSVDNDSVKAQSLQKQVDQLTTKYTDALKQVEQLQKELSAVKEELESLHKQKDAEHQAADILQQRLTDIKEERDNLRSQNDKLLDSMQNLSVLLLPPAPAERLTWWERLTGRRKAAQRKVEDKTK